MQLRKQSQQGQYQSSPAELISQATVLNLECSLDQQKNISNQLIFVNSDDKQPNIVQSHSQSIQMIKSLTDSIDRTKHQQSMKMEVQDENWHSQNKEHNFVSIPSHTPLIQGGKNIEQKQQQTLAPEEKLEKQQPLQLNNSLLQSTSLPKLKKQATHLLFPNNISIKLLEGEQKLITEDCLMANNSGYDQIKIIFTNYRIALVSERSIKLNIPIGYINKLYRTIESKPAVASYIELMMKNGQTYKLKFISQIETSDKIFNIIGKVCYSPSVVDAFAFGYSKSIVQQNNKASSPEDVAKSNGWVCNMMSQYERFGLSLTESDNSRPWKFVSNLEGRLCSSYPGIFVIPSKVTQDTLQKCLKYRSKERVPILSYAYSVNHEQQQFSCLWRAAQPKSVNQNSTRNFADEEYMKLIGIQKSNQNEESNKKNLVIYDIKPKQLINLMSNSKAIIQLTSYKNAIPKMIELTSVSGTRESYIKALTAYQNSDSTKWLNNFQQSKWIQNNYLLLKEAFNIAQDITNGYNVLVQCTDGTDRTPQLVALAQIIIDPYYRTFEGFGVLVDKQFVTAGHPFGLRLGWNKDKDKQEQKSPIFIQFLDCVYQLLKNHPLCFEFTSNYLADVSYELYSNRFGNFLCNNYQQQIENGVLFGTLSIWKHLKEQNKQLYCNHYYRAPEDTDIFYFKTPVNHKQMSIWKEHFSKFCPENISNNNYENLITQNTQDYLSFFHSKIKKQTEQLKELMVGQYSTISDLRLTLQNLSSN